MARRKPQGGTYFLIHPQTGQVMRTGQTDDLERREREHGKDEVLGAFHFYVDRRTDDYDARLGREQILHDLYQPPFNFKAPISPKNKNRQRYLAAGRKL